MGMLGTQWHRLPWVLPGFGGGTGTVTAGAVMQTLDNAQEPCWAGRRGWDAGTGPAPRPLPWRPARTGTRSPPSTTAPTHPTPTASPSTAALAKPGTPASLPGPGPDPSAPGPPCHQHVPVLPLTPGQGGAGEAQSGTHPVACPLPGSPVPSPSRRWSLPAHPPTRFLWLPGPGNKCCLSPAPSPLLGPRQGGCSAGSPRG